MTEPKFTQEPWVAGTNPCMTTVLDGHEGKAIYPKDGSNHIAWANAENEDGEIDMQTALANAALIAAAPELYEALRGAVQEACGTCAMLHVNPETYDFIEKGCPYTENNEKCDYQNCIKILRKARGEA